MLGKMGNYKINMKYFTIALLLTCSLLAFGQNDSGKDKDGNFGYTGGSFNTMQAVDSKPIKTWLKWARFHSSKDLDSILNMVNEKIVIEMPNSDKVQGKKAYRALLEKEFAEKDIYFDGYWAIPIHAVWDSNNSSWTSWRYQYRTVIDGKSHVSKSHAGIYIVDDSIQYVEIISNEVPLVEITFRVDMSQAPELAKKGVYVNGTFNNWCGSCNKMADDDGDGIYEAKVLVNKGKIEYKFTIDGWAQNETFEPETPRTRTTVDGDKVFTNRVWSTSDGQLLPVVCYNQTAACR